MTALLILFAQQSTMPQFNGMFWLLLVARICHILGAVILVGGLFYIRTILTPANTTDGTTSADQLFGGRRSTWAKWVGIATALLLISGLFNYTMIIRQHERMASSYHMMLGLKILAAIAVFLLAALLAGRTAAADAIRKKWRLWISVCLALGILAVVLGSFLRTYPRTRKIEVTGPPQLVAPANSTTR